MNISTLTRGGYSKPLLVLFDQGVISLGNFLAIVAPSKVLNGREFGVYVVSIITILMLTGITKGLITNPLRVLGVDCKKSELDIYVSDQILYMVLLSVPLATGVSFAIQIIVDASVTEAFAAGLAFFCFQIHDLSRAVRSVEFDWYTLLVSDSILHIFRIISLFTLWFYGVMDCQSALLIYAVSSLVTVSLTSFLRRLKRVEWDRFTQTVKRTWAYGRWLLGETIVYSISTQAYVLLVGIFLSTTLAGIYGALQQLVNVINIFHIGIVGYVTPNVRRKLIRGDYYSWRSILYYAALVLLIFTVLVVALLCVFGIEIIDIVYSTAWTPYASILCVFGLAAIFASVNAVLSVAFRTANFPQIGLLAKTVAAVITLLLAVPLITIWGIYGAAVGLVVTQFCWFCVYLYEIYGRSRLSEASIRAYL